MRHADWYFDFISPYAWLALHRFPELPADLDIRPRPVLFAGLLDHWGQKGPAEIPGKRLWTYRSCAFWAQTHGIPFRVPAAHPFNPLPYLRLSIAAGNTWPAIRRIFETVWASGADLADPGVVAGLAHDVGVDVARLADPAVKDALRTGTAEAVSHGVFGVPTLAIDGELFWGADAIEFAAAYLADPALLVTDEMRRIDALPMAAVRKQR